MKKKGIRKGRGRVYVMVIMAAFAMGLVGCGGTDSSDKPAGGKSSEQVTDSAEITVDDVKNHAETPASDLEYVDHGDSVSIKAYNGSDPIVVIPEQIDGKDVISIIDGPFSNDSFIKGISLPDTIKELSYTFCNNACLQVVLATGVETVGEGTFNCDNLRIVDLGDKVTTFNESNFFLGSMERLHIPAGVTELNKYMFMDGTEKLTIVGEAGSYAESYASEIGARFEAE